MNETNLKLVGDLPLSYSNWSAPQYIATSGVATECELPDWGVFSFESKVSGTDLKDEVGEVGVGVCSRDSRNSRMRESKCSVLSPLTQLTGAQAQVLIRLRKACEHARFKQVVRIASLKLRTSRLSPQCVVRVAQHES